MIVTVTMEMDVTTHQKTFHRQMIMVGLFVSRKKKCFCSLFYLKFSQIVLILKKRKVDCK